MHGEPRSEESESTEVEASAPATEAERPPLLDVATEADRPDRLTPAVAVGVLVLLLLCTALVLVAWNRAPV